MWEGLLQGYPAKAHDVPILSHLSPPPPPPHTCVSRDLQPKYMTPLEAEEVMRRLWRSESALLHLIYAAELGTPLSGGVGAAKGVTSQANECYHMFFVRVLPVAPNKFRPPSKVGEEM